jgi:hypothetical protein
MRREPPPTEIPRLVLEPAMVSEKLGEMRVAAAR